MYLTDWDLDKVSSECYETRAYSYSSSWKLFFKVV
jgi:hypothetical protein